MNAQEIRTIVQAKIAEHGVDVVKKAYHRVFFKMVEGTRMKKEGLIGGVIAVGFQDIDPDALETAITCITEAMPDGEGKDRMLRDLDFWRENREEIMADHNVTPAGA